MRRSRLTTDLRQLTVVQQEHDAQKVRQEEHDVDHMTEQRKNPIIQEKAMTSRQSRSEATGAARSEQLGRAQVLSKKDSRWRYSRAATERARRWTCWVQACTSTSKSRLHQTC